MPVSYKVVVTGNRPPFKWVVYRSSPGNKDCIVSGCSGQSDSFNEACFDAHEAAVRAERLRAHEATKETVELFSVDEVAVRVDEFPVVDREVAEPPVEREPSSPLEFMD